MPMTWERSVDTESVVVALRGVNDEISWRSVASQTGLTLARVKAVMPSARRALRSEGVLFGVVRGEGLRRLTDSDIVKKPEAFKKKVFRGAGRELKDQSLISNFGALPKVEQHTSTINRTVLNVLRQQAGVKVQPPAEKMTPVPLPNVTQLVKGR